MLARDAHRTTSSFSGEAGVGRCSDSVWRCVTTRSAGPLKRRWRYYRTATGAMPAKDFLAGLGDRDRDAVRAAMLAVRVGGLGAARHLRGDVYEVRAGRAGRAWRVLFATEGNLSQVLLAVTAFEKQTAKTPQTQLVLAEQRLKDWRRRARPS